MASVGAAVSVKLGFMPRAAAIADVDHPGLLRAGPRGSGPYGGESVEVHTCQATDGSHDDDVRPDLLESGFDVVDLSALGSLQEACGRVRAAGLVTDDDASLIRSEIDGATLPRAGGSALKVLHVADEGFIMRMSGPNGMSLVGPRSKGINGHGVATSVHADQDVYGTPLTQVMGGRAPELFRHDSPDGCNRDAGLMLVNLWVPLQQVVQPLALGDGRSIDRRRHQLRYGLATTSFLDREGEMEINDIWTFLHDAGQRWYLRSDIDHRNAYVFDTLSTPHGSSTLPGEDVAERCYRALEDAESAVADGAAAALLEAITPAVGPELPDDVPPTLFAAIAQMASLAEQAAADPRAVCDERAEEWSAASKAARHRVVRMSLEMRMVVSIES